MFAFIIHDLVLSVACKPRKTSTNNLFGLSFCTHLDVGIKAIKIKRNFWELLVFYWREFDPSRFNIFSSTLSEQLSYMNLYFYTITARTNIIQWGENYTVAHTLVRVVAFPKLNFLRYFFLLTHQHCPSFWFPSVEMGVFYWGYIGRVLVFWKKFEKRRRMRAWTKNKVLHNQEPKLTFKQLHRR